MPLFHIVVLAIIQGLTEFLPISSSAHLILVPAVTGWPDQGLAIDVAVHVGTLGAVVVYLWRDVWSMVVGVGLGFRRRSSRGLELFGILVVATVPVVIGGFVVKRYAGDALRDIEIIAWASLGFGVLLYLIDRVSLTVKRIDHMTMGGAIFIGLAQVLALIPGTSRSGITMTAARALGFERSDAARFSMLMSIPVIVAAGALSGYDLYQAADIAIGVDAAVSAGIAFVTALIAIAAMMAWLRRASFTPFVIYRVALGLFLLVWVYGFLGDFLPAPVLN